MAWLASSMSRTSALTKSTPSRVSRCMRAARSLAMRCRASASRSAVRSCMPSSHPPPGRGLRVTRHRRRSPPTRRMRSSLLAGASAARVTRRVHSLWSSAATCWAKGNAVSPVDQPSSQVACWLASCTLPSSVSTTKASGDSKKSCR